MRIFVGNLARDVTEAELQQAFAEFGQVSSVAILKDRETGEPRGFGFVEMPTDAEGKQALAGLAGRLLKGRAMRVDEARPRDDRTPRVARPAFAGRNAGFEGRANGADRDPARPVSRTFDRPPERPSDAPVSRPAAWGAERAPDWGMDRSSDRDGGRDGVRRTVRGDRDARSGPRSGDWSGLGDRDGDGQPGRANRNARATGKRKSDDPDDFRLDRGGRGGGRSRRRNRFDDEEDVW